MKNKTRRFSKSAFSVILALCMLLSCLTVGVIPTGAASIDYVDDWTQQAQKDVAAGAKAVYDASVGASAGESVGATVPAGGKIYLDTGSLSDWVGNDFYLSLTTSTAGFDSYKPASDTTWIHMDHVRGNLYSATFSSQTTVNKVSFWNKDLHTYNDIWECNASIKQTYNGTNNKFTFTSTSWNETRKSNDISGSWSVYDPNDYVLSCPSTVVSGTDIMFYIKGYGGDNVLTNGAFHQRQTGATFNTVDNGNGYAYVQAPKSGVGSYQYITNNPTDWNGNQNTDIGTSSAGKLHKADGTTGTTAAKTATTTPSTTSITTGTASITLSTTCNSTTGVYNSLPLYYQYYLDDTYVASSEKSAKTTEQSFTLNTASLTAGSYTVKTILTDGNIFYIADTDTITVSNAVVPSIDTFTIGSSTLNIGETTTISSTMSNSSNSVTYAVTAGSDVIDLTGTTVKALKPGSATITASLTGATSKTVTVTVRTPALTVTYNPSSIYVGGSTTSEPTVTATNVHSGTTISSKSFTKSGSAGTINTSTGVVTSSASTTGDVTVTATATVTYNGVSYSSTTGTATVTVKARETVYLLGLTNEYTWTKTDSGDKANKMTYNSTTGLYEITMNLYSSSSTTYSGDNGFQIDVDNSRFSKTYTLTSSATSATLAAANNNNIAITTKNTGTATAPYKFTYSTDTKLLTVYYPGKVTFNANGHGTAPAAQVIAYNGTVTAPTAPTATGYTFGGWYKEAACTNAWNFSTDKVTADTTLYAKWTEIPKYDVTVTSAVGGSVTANPTRAEAGTMITLTINPDPHCYLSSIAATQDGVAGALQISGNGNTRTFSMPSGNVTVDPIFSKTTYTGITYSAYYSTSADANTDDTTFTNSLSGATSGAPSGTYVDGVAINASKTGYTFYKWVVTNGTLVNSATTASNTFKPTANNATVKALFKKQYTLSLNSPQNGSVTSNSATCAAGDQYVITLTPGNGYKLSSLTINNAAVDIATSSDIVIGATGYTYTGVAGGNGDTISVVAAYQLIPDTVVYANKNIYNNSSLDYAYIWSTIQGNQNPVQGWPGENIQTDPDWVVDSTYPDYKKRVFKINSFGTFQIIFNIGNNESQTTDSANYEIGGTYFIDTATAGSQAVLTPGKPPYSIVGDEGLTGSNWNTNDANGIMTDNSNGTFSLTKTGTVSKSTDSDGYGYKVVTSHNYTYGQYPGAGINQNIHVLYNNSNVTFTYNPSAASNKLNATVSGGSFVAQTADVTNGTAVIGTNSTVTGSAKSLTLNGTKTYTESNYSSNYTSYEVYIKVTPNEHFEVTGWNGATPISTSKNGDVVTAKFSVDRDITITPIISRKQHTVTFTPSPTGGTVKVNNSSNTPQTVGEALTYTITVSPYEGYMVSQFEINSVAQTISSDAGFTVTQTMGNADENVTIVFAKRGYALTGTDSPSGHGNVKFYSDSTCTAEITSAKMDETVYVKYIPNSGDDYRVQTFTETYSDSSYTLYPTNAVASFTMPAAAVSVQANLILQYNVTYYVDMHNNDMTGKNVQVAITNASGTVVLLDSNRDECKKTLQKLGTSTVYAFDITTPVTQTGNNTYDEFHIKIWYGSYSQTIHIASTDASAIINSSSREVWIEGLNEAGNTFKITSATNTIPAVESGKKRIYVAKPFNWQDTETSWKNLRLYHWGEYADIGWSNAHVMTYIGYDSNYHYYYVDVDSGVSNIIFQGWKDNSTYPDVQTGNIENIGSANYFVLSKDGSAYIGIKGEDATGPGYTRYVSRVDMNVGENANITPTHTGAKVTYSSDNANVTVTSEGVISAMASATATITVKVYGTVGAKATGNDVGEIGDAMTYTVTVSVRNPGVFNNFKIMSFAHQEYTVKIPTVQNIQPGYFILNDTSVTVSGLYDGSAYTASYANSAIITETATTSVIGVGNMPTAFKVKYAASYGDYANISLKGATIKTCSIKNEGTKRFGFKEWNPSQSTISSSKVIDNGVETVTHKGLAFVTGTLTYTAEFEEYHYVDVTFTFKYDEYKPKKVDAEGNVVADDADGMIQYPYDASWANNEDSSNNQLYGRSHITKTFVVQDFEVRYRPEEGETFDGNLRNAAAIALGIEPSNNYYDYSIPNNVSATTPSNYKATSTINLIQSVKQYNVYLNGELTRRRNLSDPNDNRTYYYYQEYAELTVNTASNWYAVDSDGSNAPTTNAPLLATNTNSYKFRVKGSANSNNTYLRTDTATDPHGNSFLRSEVDFSHYEVTHQGSTPTTMKEYLMQNFYIADFFSPSEVLSDRPNSTNTGYLPYDDAQFVGGGVVYYSMNGVTDNNAGTPFANAVSSGYVNGDTGAANAAAIKEMLKANIEAQYNKDNVAGTVGEDDAMKAAYGTEIEAKKNVEGGFNTGIIYRYLPLNEYKRDGSGNLETDGEGKYTLAYDVNNNTFRYSNTLQSYQYVYASGNENKATNAGKNMRLYSYYVYSYVAYNQETNVPETRYEIVLSDNYSDASTYWEGPNN